MFFFLVHVLGFGFVVWVWCSCLDAPAAIWATSGSAEPSVREPPCNMEVDEEGDVVEDWEMWDVEEEEWEEEEGRRCLQDPPPPPPPLPLPMKQMWPLPPRGMPMGGFGGRGPHPGPGRQGGLHSLADSIMLLPFLLQKGLQKPKPKGLQKPKPKGLQKPRPKGLQKPKPQGLQKPKPKVASRKVMALETLQKGRTLQKVRTLEKVRTLQKVRTLRKVKSRVGVTPKGLEKPRGGKALKKVSPRRPNLLQKREAKPLVRGQKMMRPLRSSWPTSEGLP